MSFEECIHEIKKNNIEYVKRYIDNSDDINAKSTHTQNSILHYACKWGCTEIVQLLLEHGADVNAKNDSGKTPLQFICEITDENKRKEIFKIVKKYKPVEYLVSAAELAPW